MTNYNSRMTREMRNPNNERNRSPRMTRINADLAVHVVRVSRADKKLHVPAIRVDCPRRPRKPAPREGCQPLAGGFPTKSGHPRSRRGAFVVVVMICLLVAGM